MLPAKFEEKIYDLAFEIVDTYTDRWDSCEEVEEVLEEVLGKAFVESPNLLMYFQIKYGVADPGKVIAEVVNDVEKRAIYDVKMYRGYREFYRLFPNRVAAGL